MRKCILMYFFRVGEEHVFNTVNAELCFLKNGVHVVQCTGSLEDMSKSVMALGLAYGHKHGV